MKRSPSFDPAALTAAFAAACRGRQMTAAQYFRITAEVLRRAPCAMLVFGAGADTELYARANAGGRTAVVEHHREWADRVRHLPCEVVEVAYSTRHRDGLVERCGPPEGLSDDFLRAGWDVVLIDAPEGYRGDLPGRQQSICAAAFAAAPGAAIFLHDYERDLERRAADRYLGPPAETVGEPRVLALFRP